MDRETQIFFEEHSSPKPIPYRASKTAREVTRQSKLPYLPILGFDAPIEKMYEEALNLVPRMIEHRSTYEDNKGWKSLVLHGLGDNKTEGAERYGLDPEDQSIYHWTEVSKLAPVTTEFFRDSFKYEAYQRIRFMLLEPGGYISPHADVDYYALSPINMALNNPDGCHFVMENVGVLPFQPATIMKLALINKHAVFNNSNETRIHLIVHGAPESQQWNPIIMNSYNELVKSPRYLKTEEFLDASL